MERDLVEAARRGDQVAFIDLDTAPPFDEFVAAAMPIVESITFAD